MLSVKRSSYYAWNKRPDSKRIKRKKELTELVKKEFHDNKRIPGAVKIAENLSTPQSPVNRKLVAKIMKENGLKSKVIKKYKATTNPNHNFPVAENILNKDFKAEKPNQKWVSDITYLPTDEGWLVDGIDVPLRCASRSDDWPPAILTHSLKNALHFSLRSCRKVQFRPSFFSQKSRLFLETSGFSVELVDGIEPPTC